MCEFWQVEVSREKRQNNNSRNGLRSRWRMFISDASVVIGSLIDYVGYTNEQAGRLASIELLGMAVVSFSSYWWINRLNIRTTALRSLIVMSIANVICMFVIEYWLFASLRFVSGVAEATVLILSLSVFGSLSNKERAVAIMVSAQVLYQVIALKGLSGFPPEQTYFAILAILAFFPVIIIPLVWNWLPEYSIKDGKKTNAISGRYGLANAWVPLIGLFATMLYFTNIGAIWGFIQRIGLSEGLTAEYVGDVLALSLVISIGGALLAAWIGDRFKNITPIILATITQAIAILILMGDASSLTFAIAVILYNVGWNFILPYQLSAIANIDLAGRFVVIIVGFQAVGDAMGAWGAGLMGDKGGFSVVYPLVLFLLIVSGLLFVPVCRQYRPALVMDT